MTRKEAKTILTNLGITNRFSLRRVGFSDLARGQAQFLTVKDWKPSPKANEIKEAFKGVIVQFDY